MHFQKGMLSDLLINNYIRGVLLQPLNTNYLNRNLMRKILFLLAVFIVPFYLNAQKIKDKTIKITYNRCPLVGIDSSYKSYNLSVKTELEKVPTPEYTNMFISDLKKLEFRVKNSDINIEINYFSPKPCFGNLCYTFQASIPYVVTIKDDKGKVVYNTARNFFASTDFYNNLETAKHFLSNLEIEFWKSVLFETDNTFKLSIVYGKGKYDYTDLDSAVDTCDYAVSQYNKGKAAESQRALKKCINIWQKALTEKSLSNDQSRINKDIAVGLYVNILQVLPFANFDDKIEVYKDTVLSLVQNIKDKKNADLRRAINFAYDCKLRKEIKNGTKSLTLKDVELNPKIKLDTLKLQQNSNNIASELISFIPGYWYPIHVSKEFPGISQNESLTKNLIPGKKGLNLPMMMLPNGLVYNIDGSKQTKLFWTIKYDNASKRNILLVDMDKDLDPRSTAVAFRIDYLDKNILVVKGSTNLGDDTTEPVYIVYQRYLVPDLNFEYKAINF